MSSWSNRVLSHALVTLIVIAAALVIFSMFGGAEIAIGNLVLRAQDGSSVPLLPPPPSALVAAPFELTEDLARDGLPRNVIVILGDGMGIGTVSAASQLLSPPGVPLAMERAPVVGLMHTWAADILATDSAAAATAMATGYKTDKGVLGLSPDGRTVRNLFETARGAGLATAVVTTSGLADATPGGFLTHVASRYDYDQVLLQVIDSRTDVLIGGDWMGYYKPKRHRAYRDALTTVRDRGEARGYSVVRNQESLESASTPLLALLPPRRDAPLQHGPPLVETTGLALDLLEGSGRPYIALFESEATDEAAHSNNIAGEIDAMRELDETVAAVLARVAPRNDTLVIVVADHETGGPHLLDGWYDLGRVVVRWSHDYHSSQLVPVFAFGPGAAAFAGVFDNTQLSVRIARVLGLQGLPSMAGSGEN